MTSPEQGPVLRHDPPAVPGYELYAREAIPIKRLSYWSIVAFIPWAAFFLVTGLLIQGPNSIEIAISIPMVLGLLAILLLVMPVLHEAVHGIVAKLVGANPFYGVGAGFAYTSFREPVTPRQYATISLAPLIVLSLLSIIAFAVLPGWFVYVLAFATGNAAGAIGDLWIVQRTRHLPDDTLIYDLADGYAAFVPDGKAKSR